MIFTIKKITETSVMDIIESNKPSRLTSNTNYKRVRKSASILGVVKLNKTVKIGTI